MRLRELDPWDLIAVPMFWFLMGVMSLRCRLGLILVRLRPKTSAELEL